MRHVYGQAHLDGSGEQQAPRRTAALDWSGPGHVLGDRRPCRICRALTFLCDDEGRPCHKVCAEHELAAMP